MDETPKLQNLSQLAIDAALDCQWEVALKLNKKIIKNEPQNVDALARLARVYMEMGRYNLAKKYYCEVVKIEPYNPIALKNLKIIKSFKPNGSAKSNGYISGATHLNGSSRLSASFKLTASLFLQEPGKTKIINLLKVAEPQKLSQAYCGMPVEMLIKNRKITIVDGSGNYLGVMPDDISHHLLRLIRGGNKYELFIKAIRVNGLSILIKEAFRSKRFKNQPSFLENSDATLKLTEIFTSLDQNESEEDAEESEEEATV